MTNTWLNWPQQQLVAEQIYNFFEARKLDHYACSALVTMAEGESSFRYDALGDHNQAYGLWQLHGERCKVIRDGDGRLLLTGCGIDLTKLPTISLQCEAIHWELTHVPFEMRALDMIMNGTFPDKPRDAYTAGYMATKYYERPGAPGQAEKRAQRTVWWSDYFINLAKNS